MRKNGVYRSRTFTAKKDALAWEREMARQIEQISAIGYVQPQGLTIGKLIDIYLETPKGKQAGQAKRNVLESLQKRLGYIPIEKLNAIHLRDFIDRREADGVQGSTIANDLSYLGTVLKWAKAVKRIHCDPSVIADARATLQQRGLNTRSNERSRVPTEDELQRLYAQFRASRRMTIPMEQIVRFALASAMRRGEILGMTAEMVDTDKRTVTMKRKDPRRKDQNVQSIPMPPEAWKIITERLRERPTGRLFPYLSRSVASNFERACAKAGIHDLRFHDLRHAATVALFRAGLDIPKVALITGHRSWENLRRYTNLDASDVHAVLDGGS